MDGSCSKTPDLKRSLDDDIDFEIKKKIKSDESSGLISMKSFVDLSEDVLLILFSHISHNDLINLARYVTMTKYRKYFIVRRSI